MKTAFIKELVFQAEKNDKIWLLVGDVGFGLIEEFQEKFPDRFINCGIAEQNMIGVASGLAMQGKTVFVYSIANFALMRCLEQIRNNVCYHNLDVKIVAAGGGVQYSTLGYSHHAVEDLAVALALPNLVVAAPGSSQETRDVTRLACENPGPTYIRLGKAYQSISAVLDIGDFTRTFIGQKGARRVCIISTGGMLATAFEVANYLKDAVVISLPYLNPFNNFTIASDIVITLEDHGYGGLGTLVAEDIAIGSLPIQFHPVRMNNTITRVAGSQEYLHKLHGLDAESIIQKVKELL